MKRKRLDNFIEFWFPVAVWMGFIFWMSTDAFSSERTAEIIGPALQMVFPRLSFAVTDQIHLLIRKAAHIAEYFILGLLLFRALAREDSSLKLRKRSATYVMIIVVLYAMSDEFHQSFISSRDACIGDVLLDSSGGVLSQIAIMLKRAVGLETA
jgi:VanZ family protein